MKIFRWRYLWSLVCAFFLGYLVKKLGMRRIFLAVCLFAAVGVSVTVGSYLVGKWRFKVDLSAARTGTIHAQFRVGIAYAEGHKVTQNHSEAAKWLNEAAKGGHNEAQYNLASLYANGTGVVKDAKKAVELLTQAAKHGHIASQYLLGRMYVSDRSGELSRSEPNSSSVELECIRKLAHEGEAKSQYEFGIKYATGELVEQNDEGAMQWLHKAAAQGYPQAQNSLGVLYVEGAGSLENQGPFFRNEDESSQRNTLGLELFRESAKQGYAPAQLNLARLAKKGVRDRDGREECSFKWYTKAAEQGDLSAQAELGSLYCESFSKIFYEDCNHPWQIAQKKKKEEHGRQALKWLKKAAERGCYRSRHLLAEIYDEGKLVPKNRKLADEWFAKSKPPPLKPLKTSQRSELNRGVLLPLYLSPYKSKYDYKGERAKALCDFKQTEMRFWVDRSFEIGKSWIRKAAELGHPESQFMVVEYIPKSDDPEEDRRVAREWVQKAAQNGYAKAQFTLAELFESENGRFGHDSEAVHWYKQAGKNGLFQGHLMAGVMYWQGRGVAKSRSMALWCVFKALKTWVIYLPDMVEEKIANFQ